MKDQTIIDSRTGTMRCERCGEEVPAPLGSIDWVLAVMRAFSREHRRCHKGGPCYTGFETRTGKRGAGRG